MLLDAKWEECSFVLFYSVHVLAVPVVPNKQHQQAAAVKNRLCIKQQKCDGKQSLSTASPLHPAVLDPTNEATGFRQI